MMKKITLSLKLPRVKTGLIIGNLNIKRITVGNGYLTIEHDKK